jgi:hypothetical protein
MLGTDWRILAALGLRRGPRRCDRGLGVALAVFVACLASGCAGHPTSTSTSAAAPAVAHATAAKLSRICQQAESNLSYSVIAFADHSARAAGLSELAVMQRGGPIFSREEMLIRDVHGAGAAATQLVRAIVVEAGVVAESSEHLSFAGPSIVQRAIRQRLRIATGLGVTGCTGVPPHFTATAPDGPDAS